MTVIQSNHSNEDSDAVPEVIDIECDEPVEKRESTTNSSSLGDGDSHMEVIDLDCEETVENGKSMTNSSSNTSTEAVTTVVESPAFGAVRCREKYPRPAI